MISLTIFFFLYDFSNKSLEIQNSKFVITLLGEYEIDVHRYLTTKDNFHQLRTYELYYIFFLVIVVEKVEIGKEWSM